MLKPLKKHTVVDPRWWFVCVVASNKEMAFRRELAKNGILNFTPIRTKLISVYGKRSVRMSPLFPNYVFVYGEHYSKFKKRDDWNGFVYCINEDDEVIYKMPHQIIYDLILKQSLGEFDLTKAGATSFTIGDIVDVVGIDETEPVTSEKREFFLLRSAAILSMGPKRAVVIVGNRAWKIKLCYLRKSVDKSSPL